jgi:FecR protein
MRTFALRCRWCKDLRVGLALLLLLSVGTFDARADDPPIRRAARLSFLQGNVTIDHLDNTAGDPAQINMPLFEGVRLTTGEDGQAEVEFEDGSVVRVTPNTSLGLSSLSVDAAGIFHTQLTVIHGLVYAELRAASRFTYTVDAGGELISPVANASMRINLDQPPAIVSVFDGAVHIEHASSPEADGYKTDVRAGETLTGDASDSSRYFLSPSIEQDSWDVWNQARDEAAAEAAVERTAARDGFAGDQGYGWSDLDANGSWYDVPGQGQVWQPTVALDASFDPYGYGSWVAYPGAGYVWASGYGWGWTPFRCGNWSYWNSFGWGWSPVGCGLPGWNFGGVFVINIIRPPLNYRLPTRPVHKSGMPNSIPIGHPAQEPGHGVRPSQEPRLIAGMPVEPLRPIGNASTPKNHNMVGAALRSDFAVDRTSRQPVLGMSGAASPATPRSDSWPAPPRPIAPAAANRTQPPPSELRPAPPPQQRSGYPTQTQGERSAPRPPAPTYRPPPSPPPPPAPRSTPSTPAPAAPRE